MRLPLIAATALLCSSALAQTTEFPYDTAPGVSLGYGWDQLRLIVSTDSPLTRSQPVRQSAEEIDQQALRGAHTTRNQGQVVESRLTYVESVEQLRSLTEAAASFSYSSGFNSVSGKSSFFRAVEQNTYDLHFLVQVKVTQSGTRLNPPTLNDTALSILKKNVGEFHETYGTDFISGITFGGEYLGMITIHTSSRNEQQKVAAELSASTLSFNAHASFSSSVAKLNREARVEVQEYMVGGSGMDTLTTTTGSSAVQQLMNRAHTFPATVLHSPQPMRFLVSNYSGLGQYVANRSAKWTHDPQTDEFRRLAQMLVDYEGRVEDFDFALTHPDAFHPFNHRELSTWRTTAQSTIDTLSSAISDFRSRHNEGLLPAKDTMPIAQFDKQRRMPQRYDGYVDGMRSNIDVPTLGTFHLTKHTRGDSEIDGHDVTVSASVSIELGSDHRSLYRVVHHVRVKEAKHDWTTFETSYRDTSPFYVAPEGLLITSFAPGTDSFSTRTHSSKGTKTFHSSKLLQSVKVLTDTKHSHDDLYFTAMTFRPVTVNFVHEELANPATPR